MGKLGLVLALICAASAAQAELTFCNRAEVAQTVGMAYKTGKSWFSEGWWTIDPAGCKVLVAGDLQQRDYYYTVKSNDNFVGEGHRFCAKDESYDLTGADGDCGALGATVREYARIDTGDAALSFTFDLTASTSMPNDKVANPFVIDLPAAAMTESFTPGQEGEPFTITARMQGCADDVSYWSCTVVAEGWMWDFDVQGVHNDAAIAAMRDLPVNTMLYVTGDVIQYNDITVVAQVAKIELAPRDAISDSLDRMQGRWISADDAQSVLDITGSLQTSRYGSDESRAGLMTFPGACPDGGQTDGTTLVVQELGTPPEDALCYDILSLTNDRMELMYLPRGNILTYLRL